MFRSFTSNATSVWTPSKLDHNWVILTRAFTSKPAASDVVGIDLGTTNFCVVVTKEKNSKVAEKLFDERLEWRLGRDLFPLLPDVFEWIKQISNPGALRRFDELNPDLFRKF